jgi:hypothetical protein
LSKRNEELRETIYGNTVAQFVQLWKVQIQLLLRRCIESCISACITEQPKIIFHVTT